MKIMIGIGVLIAVLVGVALLLPFIVDLNKYQEQYRPLIEDALNRKVTLAGYSFDHLAQAGRAGGGIHGHRGSGLRDRSVCLSDPRSMSESS